MQRIIVLGCAGAGKTTYARRLAATIGTPAIILDEIWQADWTADDTPAFRAILERLHAADAWVSDGNFAAVSFDLRLPRADLVVWIERSRWVCAWRAAVRVFRAGEPHRVADLPKVLAFIWRFDGVNRPTIERLLRLYGPDLTVVRLYGDWQMEEVLRELSPI